jgi:hypothetical protein
MKITAVIASEAMQSRPVEKLWDGQLTPVIPGKAGIHEPRTVFVDPAFARVTAAFFIQRGSATGPAWNSQ